MRCHQKVCFAALCIVSLGLPAHASMSFGKLLDLGTPVLSTADAGSDAYVCWHFWETAKKEHVRPIFFSCSATLLILSSLCGVSMFLFLNWGTSEDEDAAVPFVKLDQLGLEEMSDDEGRESGAEHVQEEGVFCARSFKGWFPRLRISSYLNRITSCAEDLPLLQLVLRGVLVLLLLLALLPVGQLLPIILFLQAQQELTKAPKVPVAPELPEKPQCPDDFSALNRGREVSLIDFNRIWQTATRAQKFSPEWINYYTNYKVWLERDFRSYLAEYYLFLDQRDRYFRWQLKAKIATSLPFIIETLVEAIPQSLLQTTAIVIDSQRNPEAISPVQFISIAMSMVSIASKAYILCSSLVQVIFNFKIICVAYDITALFYTIAAFWSTRRDDDDAVTVFFLTRPIDICTASYLWVWFAWGCLFFLWSLLRAFAFVLEWRILSITAHADDENQSLLRIGQALTAFSSITKKLPFRLSFVTEAGKFDADNAPVVISALFTLVSIMFAAVAVSCSLLVVIIPLGVLIMLPRMYWICMWLKRMENNMSSFSVGAPQIVDIEYVSSQVKHPRASDTPIGGRVYVLPGGDWEPGGHGVGFLHLAEKPDDLMTKASYVDKKLVDFMKEKHLSSPLFWMSTQKPPLFTEVYERDDPEKYNTVCSDKSGFYVQAFAFVSEGRDLTGRLSAVKRAILMPQATDDADDEDTTAERDPEVSLLKAARVLADEQAQVKLPWCLLPRLFCLVVANIADSVDLLQAPRGFFDVFTGATLSSTFSKPSQNGTMKIKKWVDELIHKQNDDKGDSDVDDSDSDGDADDGDRLFFEAISCWRGLKPYWCMYVYFVFPLGWFVQKLLIGMTCAFSLFSFFFPIISFAVTLRRAVQDNQCETLGSMLSGNAELSPAVVSEAMLSLFDEGCYEQAGRHLNLFRTGLFLLQALVFFIAALYGAVEARKFILFCLLVPAFDLRDGENTDNMMERVQALYARLYAPKEESTQIDELGDEDGEAGNAPAPVQGGSQHEEGEDLEK